MDIRVIFVRATIAIAVFFIFWLLRRGIGGLLLMPFRKLANKTDGDLDNAFVAAMEEVIGWLIIALTIILGANIVGLGEAATTFFYHVASTLVAYGIAKFIWVLTTNLLETKDHLKSATGIDIESAMLPMIRVSIRILTVVLTALIIAQIWQMNIGAIAATIGLGGLALSLAAKEVLDDFVGFGAIIGDDIYRNKEYIISPYAEGVVEQIGMRSTRVRQLNQGVVTVPNAKIAEDWVVNWSRLEKRWFNFELAVAYTTHPDTIEDFTQRVEEMLKTEEHVLSDEGILASFVEYDDYAYNIMIRCWHDIDDYNESKRYRQHINLQLMRIIHDMQIDIALPTQKLHVDTLPQQFYQTANGNGHTNGNGKKREKQHSFEMNGKSSNGADGDISDGYAHDEGE